jgi:putative FmdB family regulatory protein
MLKDARVAYIAHEVPMPIYEYQCGGCSRVSSFLVRNVGEHRTPACPRCGAQEMSRVLSRFSAISRGDSASSGTRESDLGDAVAEAGGPEGGMPDLSALEGVDESDPRSLGRALRKMARDTGEEMDPEMDEICRRLESGEDPEKIEEGLEGGAGEDGGSDDTLYDG